jgi:multidrug efflux pump subunit AcrA (membrane-fusion protein)
LIKVPDPLAMTPALKGKPKLMIGTFVEVHIQADAIENVVQLNRDYVRSNETVWVMKNEKLEIRKVAIVLTDDTHAYINEGLEDDEKVVTTDLSTVSNGLELRTGTETSKNEMDQ